MIDFPEKIFFNCIDFDKFDDIDHFLCAFHALVLHLQHFFVICNRFFGQKESKNNRNYHHPDARKERDADKVVHEKNPCCNLQRSKEYSCKLVSHISHSLCIDLTVIDYLRDAKLFFAQSRVFKRFAINHHCQRI